MRKNAFSLMEMLVVIVVVGILATLGYPVYQNTIEDANSRVCTTNLRALDVALEIYAMEHDALPGDLSELSPGHLQKAYAAILREKGAWKIKLAYYVVGLRERGLAYAGLLNDLAGGNVKLLTCPADHTPPSAGGRSYGMNSALANMSYRDFQNLSDDTVLIGDSETDSFSGSALTERHRRFNIAGPATDFANGSDRGKRWVRVENGSVAVRRAFPINRREDD